MGNGKAPQGAQDARQVVLVECSACCGTGAVQVTVPVCCNIPTKTGECCCNPVPAIELDICESCGGEGGFRQ